MPTAASELSDSGFEVQVVSMPCQELFDEQPSSYQNKVLPPATKARIVVEAGIEMGWQKYLGSDGEFVGMHSFGASAPYEELYEQFEITMADVFTKAHGMLTDD